MALSLVVVKLFGRKVDKKAPKRKRSGSNYFKLPANFSTISYERVTHITLPYGDKQNKERKELRSNMIHDLLVVLLSKKYCMYYCTRPHFIQYASREYDIRWYDTIQYSI